MSWKEISEPFASVLRVLEFSANWKVVYLSVYTSFHSQFKYYAFPTLPSPTPRPSLIHSGTARVNKPRATGRLFGKVEYILWVVIEKVQAFIHFGRAVIWSVLLLFLRPV